MKLALSILALANFLFPQKEIYNIQFKGLNGDTIDMASYRGKKIIVAGFASGGTDLSEWRLLDSLYRKNQNKLVVIAVPLSDLVSVNSGVVPTKQMLRDSLHISFPIAAQGKGRKEQGANQQPLLHWLTNKEENGHFNTDIVEDGQLFIINEAGRLYAVLRKKSLYKKALIDRILNEKAIHP
ncbi:MAG: hypothetical protein EPN37_09545 [Chitinophagaceae bacterium]|nr:MAG: hypothetical protein EPN37_09545 [Chitinophagaceae bacterium]